MGGRGSSSSSSQATTWNGRGTGTADERIEKALRHLEQNSGWVPTKASFGNADPELLEANVEQLVMLDRIYGIGDGTKTKLYSESGRGIAWNEFYGSLSIGLNKDYYSNPDRLIRSQYRSAEPRSIYGNMPWHYLTPDMSPETVRTYSITHEYGHALQGYMARSRSGGSADQYAASVKRQIMRTARNKYGLEKGARAGHSGYAAASSAEFFAEAFAGYHAGYVNPVTLAMGDWLKDNGF